MWLMFGKDVGCIIGDSFVSLLEEESVAECLYLSMVVACFEDTEMACR